MVTMTSADSALKEFYLGAVSEQLNTSVNPLWQRSVKARRTYGAKRCAGWRSTA